LDIAQYIDIFYLSAIIITGPTPDNTLSEEIMQITWWMFGIVNLVLLAPDLCTIIVDKKNRPSPYVHEPALDKGSWLALVATVTTIYMTLTFLETTDWRVHGLLALWLGMTLVQVVVTSKKARLPENPRREMLVDVLGVFAFIESVIAVITGIQAI
jgi:hypothetical protein